MENPEVRLSERVGALSNTNEGRKKRGIHGFDYVGNHPPFNKLCHHGRADLCYHPDSQTQQQLWLSNP